MEKLLKDYKILGLIGSGGMGDVYLGEDIHLKRKVAIKALKPGLMDAPNVIERFRREAVTSAKLSHPNVAAIYSFLQEEGSCYLVMEYISGWELNTLIEKVGALPPPVALFLCKQILAGIHAIHGADIVHRDLKPNNIMITENLAVKVMDFGIARSGEGNRLTRNDKLIGTIEYMSPEQILGEDATPVSDIYSLGILLFEMVTAQIPFSGNSEYEIMKSKVEKPPPSPLDLKADIPKRLANILSCALANSPQDRYQSAEAFIRVLDETSIDTSGAKSELSKIIHLHQLEKEKNSVHSPLLDDRISQEIPFSKPNEKLKNRLLSYVNLFFGKIGIVFSHNLWLGPLILLLSLMIVLGIFLLNNEKADNLTRNDVPMDFTAKEELRTPKRDDSIIPQVNSNQKDANAKELYNQPIPGLDENARRVEVRRPSNDRPAASTQLFTDEKPSMGGPDDNTAENAIPKVDQKKENLNIVSDEKKSSGWIIHKENE